MAPMTRLRADDDHVVGDLVVEYYSQRSAVPGTLIISEATFISANSRGRDRNAPGVYSDRQIAGWKRVTDTVHKNGSFMFIQLWHVGRAAQGPELHRLGLEMLSSSDIPISDDRPTPRPMTEDEIQEAIRSFALGAQSAVDAGADGVELHAANGYLIDQFTQDTCNRRSDRWGGSVDNRSRFCLEVVEAVCNQIGADRVAIRLSPFAEFQGMGMKDPIPQFTHLIGELRKFGLAYLHLIEPRVSGNVERTTQQTESLQFALEAWAGAGPVIFAGGYTAEKANNALNNEYAGVSAAFAFGRVFTANPDLPSRIFGNIPLTKYDRTTFYTAKSRIGYTDYPQYTNDVDVR